MSSYAKRIQALGAQELPFCIESEKQLIGCALLGPENIPTILQFVTADDFYDTNNQQAFRALCTVHANVGTVDSVLLYEELSRDAQFDRQMYSVGYFDDLKGVAASAVVFRFHARNIAEAARLRRIIDSCCDTAFRALGRQTDSTTLLSEHQGQVNSILAQKCERAGAAHGDPVLIRMSDVTPRKTQWLWPGRISQNSISLISGRPGDGKSMVTMDAAATVSTGRNWPDGSPCPQGSVILLAGEDHPEETICPRLIAHGADLTKIHLLVGSVRIDSKGEQSEVLFNLGDVKLLEATLEKHPDVKFIIIDPIGSFIGGAVDTDKDNKVRAVLAPLAKLAREKGVAILMVAHTRKGSATYADDMVMGSRAFTGIARSVLHLMVHPADKERRVLLPGKCNLGKPAPGMGFSIKGDPARIEWEPDPVVLNADDVLASQSGSDPKSPTELDRATDWLADLLASGSLSAKAIEEAAKTAGFSWPTIKRAKEALEIKPKKSGLNGPWMWSLPGLSEDVQLPESLIEDAHALEFEHLREKQAENTENPSKMLNCAGMSTFEGDEPLGVPGPYDEEGPSGS